MRLPNAGMSAGHVEITIAETDPCLGGSGRGTAWRRNKKFGSHEPSPLTPRNAALKTTWRPSV
eukprot:10356400-Lingulodinium_polyedra.AAC.1